MVSENEESIKKRCVKANRKAIKWAAINEDNQEYTDTVTPFDVMKTPGKKQKEPEECKVMTRSQKKRNKRANLDHINAKRKRQE